MNRRRALLPRNSCLICWLLILIAGPQFLEAQPSPAAEAAYNSYVQTLETRLEHRSPVLQQAIVVQRIAELNLPGALLHHWHAEAFAPGARAADVERLLRNFGAYPQRYTPEVLRAQVLSGHDDHVVAWMRVRQHHVLTVVMDTTYDVTFGRRDAQHGWSVSRSTRIAEIAAPGTAKEHALSAADEHGFLWRMNTYWSWEERDGGVYLQVESVSLSRAIPTGLGWAVKPFVESIPRESLGFTLRSTCDALRRDAKGA